MVEIGVESALGRAAAGLSVPPPPRLTPGPLPRPVARPFCKRYFYPVGFVVLESRPRQPTFPLLFRDTRTRGTLD